MDEELKDNILKYIESHNVCTIALADGSKPVAHTMYYVSRDMNIYLESDPNSQKIHVVRANPLISLTIDEDYQDWRQIAGIELQGSARVLKEAEAPRIQDLFLEKFPHINDLGGIPEHHVFIEVVPEKIYFMDFKKKFGHKSIYYPEEPKKRISW